MNIVIYFWYQTSYICDDDEISISFVCDISAHIIVVADFVGGIVWS